MNILHINIQSIRNKLNDLSMLITNIENQNSKKKIHVIAHSEIRIYNNENKYYNINGYDVYFSNRGANRSAGYCVFVLNEITSTLVSEFEYKKSNFLVVKLIKSDIHVACIYRYGESNVNNFNDKLETEILKHKRTLQVGDININLKNGDNDTKSYIDTIQSNGVVSLNSLNNAHYTRERNAVCTLYIH